MANCKKPELSPKLRTRLNEMYLLLKQREWLKEELMRHFDTGERQIREMINILRKRAPVISRSNGKGYRIARGEADLDDAVHTWQEFDSRIEDMQESKGPLIKFVESMR